MSLFMQCPKTDIPPIIQFEVKRYYRVSRSWTQDTKSTSVKLAMYIEVNRISYGYSQYDVTMHDYTIHKLNVFHVSDILHRKQLHANHNRMYVSKYTILSYRKQERMFVNIEHIYDSLFRLDPIHRKQSYRIVA